MNHQIFITSFQELYDWLNKNHQTSDYVWVNAKRGKPNGIDFNYLDLVYCSLCFGWIDSTCKNFDGILYQKIMPRSFNSHWTYLNIARCQYLINKGLMTDSGLKVMPKNYKNFEISADIVQKLQQAAPSWHNFCNFPELYQRIRIDNIEWARKNPATFNKRLDKLIETSRQNKMYGNWNDYGRLN